MLEASCKGAYGLCSFVVLGSLKSTIVEQEYLHHGNGQALQIRAFFFFFSSSREPNIYQFDNTGWSR